MTARSLEAPPRWLAVRLTTEHFVLDTYLTATQYERLHTPSPDDLLPCLCLPETTLRVRSSPHHPTVLTLPHCVIARSLILHTQPFIHPPIETPFEESRRTRALKILDAPRPHLGTLPSIPMTVTATDFVLQPIRLVTPHVTLDAHITIYRGWASRTPKEWIRSDQRAMFSLSAIHLQTRANESGHSNASLTLDSCDLSRLDILHATFCPAA